MKTNIIVAVDDGGGFGKDGKIPWHFKCDFKHFREVTGDSICVMGKNTYVDMLEMMQARNITIGDNILPKRKCYVISSTLEEAPGATIVPSLQTVRNEHPDDTVFICGGERLYKQALASTDTIYMTVIDSNYGCDRMFPVDAVEEQFDIVEGRQEEEDGTNIMFIRLERKQR